MVISGHQWSSEVIRGHQRSSVVISGHPWSSEARTPAEGSQQPLASPPPQRARARSAASRSARVAGVRQGFPRAPELERDSSARISRNQRSSAALSGTQRHSVALSRTQRRGAAHLLLAHLGNSRNQRSSVAISDHQSQSAVISRNQRSSVAISGHQSQSPSPSDRAPTEGDGAPRHRSHPPSSSETQALPRRARDVRRHARHLGKTGAVVSTCMRLTHASGARCAEACASPGR